MEGNSNKQQPSWRELQLNWMNTTKVHLLASFSPRVRRASRSVQVVLPFCHMLCGTRNSSNNPLDILCALISQAVRRQPCEPHSPSTTASRANYQPAKGRQIPIEGYAQGKHCVATALCGRNKVETVCRGKYALMREPRNKPSTTAQPKIHPKKR